MNENKFELISVRCNETHSNCVWLKSIRTQIGKWLQKVRKYVTRQLKILSLECLISIKDISKTLSSNESDQFVQAMQQVWKNFEYQSNQIAWIDSYCYRVSFGCRNRAKLIFLMFMILHVILDYLGISILYLCRSESSQKTKSCSLKTNLTWMCEVIFDRPLLAKNAIDKSV